MNIIIPPRVVPPADWEFDIYESLYEDIDLSYRWPYDNKDVEIYGYGGTRYLEGRDSMPHLYCWYQKYGFIENPLLNTYYKYFTMTPLPAMEFNLTNYSLNTICRVFLEKKYLIKPILYQELTDYDESKLINSPKDIYECK